MAEGGSARQLLCRFFSKGYCRNESNCQFSHDARKSTPVPEDVCWYYLLNQCAFGDNCRSLHLEPDEICNLVKSKLSASGCLSGTAVGAKIKIPASSSPSTASHSSVIESCGELPQSVTFDTHHQPDNYSSVNESCHRLLPTAPCFQPVLYSPKNQRIVASTNTENTAPPENRQPSQDSGFCDQYPIYTDDGSPDSTNAHENYAYSQTEQQLEFLPENRTYAQATGDVWNTEIPGDEIEHQQEIFVQPMFDEKTPLCPLGVASDECMYGVNCKYPLHGDRCDLCNRLCVHPYDEDQRKQHRDECVKEHEREMELSFAIQRSIDKNCGICMDTVMEKEPPSRRRFGILEKCNHIFCLPCIRKWRTTKQFDNKTIRACPECRVPSDFVVPSKYWVDTSEDKDKLIESYKTALSEKPCKYFNQGQGECPFAGACFYLHAYPDGTRAKMEPPRPRRRQNQDGEVEILRDMLLWNYVEIRDDRHWLLTMDFEGLDEVLNIPDMFSDTDDSDFSDY